MLRMIVARAWSISSWFIETLGTGRIPYLWTWAMEFAWKIFSLRIQLLFEIMGTRTRIVSNGCFRVEIFIHNRPHWPIWSIFNSKFFISAGTWKLYSIQLNIASRCGFSSAYVYSASLLMLFIKINKSVNFIMIRRWRFIVRVLPMIKISFFPISKCRFPQRLSISQIIDVITTFINS